MRKIQEYIYYLKIRRPPRSTLLPNTTLYRSPGEVTGGRAMPPSCPPRSAPLQQPGTSTARSGARDRSEEHTSELQSRQYLACRLLLEKKKFPPLQRVSTRLGLGGAHVVTPVA